MAIDRNYLEEIRGLWDLEKFQKLLSSDKVSEKDKLYAYLRIMDYLAPKQQAAPPDAGKGEKDASEKLIDGLFKKR